MKLTEAIGFKIKDLLEERNLNQYWLFKNGGIPRSTICDVINSKKKKVSTNTIYQICSTLDITLSEFFSDPYFDDLED